MSPNAPHTPSANHTSETSQPNEDGTTTTTSLQTRRKFFCGLLDSRKAVIIVNALAILGSGLLLIPTKLRLDATIDDIQGNDTYKEDTIQERVEILDRLFFSIMIVTLIGFFFRSMAIVGAIQFCPRFVLYNVVYMITNLGLTIGWSFAAKGKVEDFDYGPGDWIPKIIGTMIAVLVHLTLVREIMTGVTTKETYPSDEKTCCFVV